MQASLTFGPPHAIYSILTASILPPDWVLWRKLSGLLYNTKQEAGCFQNKHSECFQRVYEWQMVDQVKASTEIRFMCFLL